MSRDTINPFYHDRREPLNLYMKAMAMNTKIDHLREAVLRIVRAEKQPKSPQDVVKLLDQSPAGREALSYTLAEVLQSITVRDVLEMMEWANT